MKKETKNKIIGNLIIFIPLIFISIIFKTFWILLIGISYSGYVFFKKENNEWK